MKPALLVVALAGVCAQASAAPFSLQSLAIATRYPVEARLYTPLAFPEDPESVLSPDPLTADVILADLSPAVPAEAPDDRAPDPPTGFMSLTIGLGLITAVTLRRRIAAERRTRFRRRVRKLIRLMA